MAKISDIFKKKPPAPGPYAESKPKEKKEETPAISPIQFAQVIKEKEAPEKAIERAPHDIQITKELKELKVDDTEHSKAFCAKGLQLIKELLINIEGGGAIELKPIKDFTEEVIDEFARGEKMLLTHFYCDYAPEHYLCNHMLNVMIMSIAVGLRLGYNKSRLGELGLAAFLHDIGMVEVKGAASKLSPLSEEERKQIKNHPIYSAEILSKLNVLKPAVIYAIKEQHERLDGTGYPRGLKNGEISDYGRIIATIDVYEALLHQRAYRKRLAPYEAVKQMLSSGHTLFDPQVFKVMIDLIGIYPVGSYAELNSNEIAKVASPNEDFPLRPVVNIIFDANKNRLAEPRLVNLAKQFNLYIKKPLSDEEVSELIKE